MALKTRVQPINRDIELMIKESLSPAAQSREFAQFAGEQIEDAKRTNKTILGRTPRLTVSVDGKFNAPLASVRPNGVVIAEFELLTDALAWIGEQLVRHSPVKTGRYQRSHTLFADGKEIDVGAQIPDAEEFVFINIVPYARKIERGSSSQAPNGVYQAVATLAARRFGNIAKISYGFRTAISGVFVGGAAGNKSSNRNPAIIVRVGK